jgi:hypothetical protein
MITVRGFSNGFTFLLSPKSKFYSHPNNFLSNPTQIGRGQRSQIKKISAPEGKNSLGRVCWTVIVFIIWKFLNNNTAIFKIRRKIFDPEIIKIQNLVRRSRKQFSGMGLLGCDCIHIVSRLTYLS